MSRTSWRPAAVALAVLLSAILAAASPLPASPGAPKVGSKAPDFSLPDSSGHPISLSKVLEAGPTGSWVLLVFYRGYW